MRIELVIDIQGMPCDVGDVLLAELVDLANAGKRVIDQNGGRTTIDGAISFEPHASPSVAAKRVPHLGRVT